MSPASPGRPGVWAALLLAGVPLFLFSGAVFGGQVFFKRDLVLTVYPQIEAFVRAVATGSWPVWDPASSFGQPLLADSGAHVLYPPGWLNLLLRPWTYHAAFVIAHLWASGMGLYRLGRRLGLSPGAAGASAALWITSGPLQSTVDLPHHFAGACWMPWVLLAADTALASGRSMAVIAFGAALAGQILAGSPDVLAMTGCAVLALGAARHGRVGHGSWSANRRLLKSSAAALLVALGLTAALWMTALDVASRSARRGLPLEVRTMWSVHPATLADLVFPNVWRSFVPRTDPRADREVREPFFETYYLGAAALGLVGAAFARPPRRTVLVLLLLGAGAVLVSLGRHAPFYSWAVALVPPLEIVRYPVKALLLAALSWVLLAGLGFDALLARDTRSKGRFRLAVGGPLLLVAALAVAGDLILTRPALEAPLEGLLARLRLDLPPPEARPHLAWLLAITASVATLALGLAWLSGRKSPRAKWAVAGLALLAVADLSVYHRYPSLAPRALVLHRPEALSFVGDAPSTRLFVYDYLVPGPSVRGQPFPIHIARLPPGWTTEQGYALGLQMALAYASAQRWGLRGGYEGDLRGLHPASLVRLTRRLVELEDTAAWTRLLRMGAITHVVSLHDLGREGLVPVTTLPGLFPSPIRIYRVSDPLPRAYVIARTRIADDAAALRRFAEPDWDPARELLLPEGEGRSPARPLEGSVRILDEGADRIALQAEVSEAAYVVLVDTFDPGWRATVDGEPRPTLRANVAFRAVAVPAGRHVVAFVYRPWPLQAGVAVSVLTILVVAGWLVAVRRRAAARSVAPVEGS